MIIKNVKVYGEDFQFHPGDVVIETAYSVKLLPIPEK